MTSTPATLPLTAAPYTPISGTGSYLPGNPVGNVELIDRYGLDSSDDWIVERTGIRSRHLAPAAPQ